MRLNNSLKNMYIAMFSQVIITLLGFVTRKIFIDSLGAEYLGINGLLTNVLSMLSLVEGGIGTSIVYNLYKPLAENNEEKVIALVQLYKKLYGILSVVILGLSLCLYPFLGYLIQGGENLSYITLVYFIFVFRNIVSYLNAHKWSLINADQKGYVLSRVNLIFNIITTIAKIIIIYVTKSYVAFLVVDLLIYLIQTIFNGNIVNKYYPYIKTKQKYRVEADIKQNLVTNVKALFWHNVGKYCVFGTDNLLISSLISIQTVGLYSNYTMIIGQLSTLVGPILGGINASVGNLVATEHEDKSYEVFKVVYLVNFWMYAWCAIFLYNLLEPFIDWWIGPGFLLDDFTFIVILINFYIAGVRTSVGIFKDKAGIFADDQYVPILESIVNLGASFILVKYFGLAGIFLGTTISSLLFPVWNQPRLVYKKLFKKPVRYYFMTYIFYATITIIIGFVTTVICNILVTDGTFIALVLKGLICLAVPNVILIAIFYNRPEFLIIRKIIIKILGNLRFSFLRKRIA